MTHCHVRGRLRLGVGLAWNELVRLDLQRLAVVEHVAFGRIAIRPRLDPMSREETAAYIKHLDISRRSSVVSRARVTAA